MNRRQFGALTLSSLVVAEKISAAAAPPLGVQLYSVRAIGKVDLAGVLSHLAESGYDGVEFAGYYGHSAQEIREMLNRTGLKVAGSHVDFTSLLGDELPKTVEFNLAIGNRLLVVPSVPEKYRTTIAGWRDAGKAFSEIAERLRPSELMLGYHNHAREFLRLEGELPFDAFFRAANQSVKVQLDVGHALQGGADPVELLHRFKGRIISVHIKDFSQEKGITDFGGGAMNWPAVFRAVKSDRNIAWYVSEEEGKNCQAYDCVDRSIKKIRAFL
jgi:sugar phosphate isomerase/epimerase